MSQIAAAIVDTQVNASKINATANFEKQDSFNGSIVTIEVNKLVH